MSIELTIAIVVLLGCSPLLVRLAAAGMRRRRTPAELRGEWWERFEGEFRAYAARSARRREARGPGYGGKPE
ncbi:MAG: hypothetical protein ACRDL5_18520 [Solirubrobacteraceae bacterium]